MFRKPFDGMINESYCNIQWFQKVKYLLRFLPHVYRAEVFNLLSSRANLHLSYNPAGRIHCRLQNNRGYIKHHHRGMGGSPGDIGEVPMP